MHTGSTTPAPATGTRQTGTRHLLPTVYCLLPALVVYCMLVLLPATPAHAAGALVVVGSTPDSIYVTSPDGQAVMLLRRNGTVVAERRLDGAPSGLAFDPRQNVLYVALSNSSRILVLDGATLRGRLTLRAPRGATGLAAVSGQDALYLFDPGSQRTLHLTYTAGGAVRLSAVFAAITAPKVARVHVTLERATGRASERATFWANGFSPGEPVSVSWGASDRGRVSADRYGIVSGGFPLAAPLQAGPHDLALYGLFSHRIETGLVTIGGHDARRVRRPALPPPLYLGVLPGPVATLTPPVLRKTIRVPMAAGALPALPISALIGLLVAQRRKRRARRAAAQRAPRRPARR